MWLWHIFILMLTDQAAYKHSAFTLTQFLVQSKSISYACMYKCVMCMFHQCWMRLGMRLSNLAIVFTWICMKRGLARSFEAPFSSTTHIHLFCMDDNSIHNHYTISSTAIINRCPMSFVVCIKCVCVAHQKPGRQDMLSYVFHPIKITASHSSLCLSRVGFSFLCTDK